MNKYIKLTVFFIIISFLSGCSFHDKEKVIEKTDSEKKAEINDLSKKALSSRYNSIIFDDENFLYSINIQDKIKEQRPFLLEGSVNDIFYKDEKKYIKISPSFFSTYVAILDVGSVDISELLGKSSANNLYTDDYFFIVSIDDVKKAALQVDGYSPTDSEDVELELNAETGFLIYGKLLEIKKQE